MKHSAHIRGFTLIELMVSVFITALLLAMGYGAVNQAFADHAALDSRQERLLAVQTAMRLFTQDFTQLAPRPVRQPLGDGWLPGSLRYMDVSFIWRDQWPPQALPGDPTANLRLRPIAVEVTLELEDWGKLVRVIEVAA